MAVDNAVSVETPITVPIVTIDGPSGTGKGTLAHNLAAHLGWHLLDSGVIYRVLAYFALKQSIALDNESELVALINQADVQFCADDPQQPKILLNDQDVTTEIRTESIGDAASRVAQFPNIRQGVLDWQRQSCRLPGLVADGRDMGTVVFPEARAKIYLDASADIRAERRHKELISRGINVSLQAVFSELKMRDQRDMARAIAPLKPALDATIIDTSSLSKAQVFDLALAVIEKAYAK